MLHVIGALAALVLVSGLLVRGAVGLTTAPDQRIVRLDPATGQVLDAGIELEPSTSAPLFDHVALAPGETRAACLTITHRGGVPNEAVLLRLDATGGSQRLLETVQLVVERGDADGPGCERFTPQATVASGTVAGLAASGGTGWASWTPGDGERARYRFSIHLPGDVTDELQGEEATADLLWVATAVPTGGDLASRTLLVAAGVARDALLPLLVLATLAVLFLGIQDRIDRRDPKLARAAVVEPPRAFEDPIAPSHVVPTAPREEVLR